MDAVIAVIAAVVGIGVGVGGGFVIKNALLKRDAESAGSVADKIVSEADDSKKRILLEAKEEALQERRNAENEIRNRRREAQRGEDRLTAREESLDKREDSQDKRQEMIELREDRLTEREQEVEESRDEAEALKAEQATKLEHVAGLSTAEAKDQIMQTAEGEMEHELAKRYYGLEQQMLAEVDDKAKKVISLAIQRLAADVTSENTTSIVPLPSDEMKGRLIGREGRNIRAIEAATGVDLIIDDTPEAITISCFEPVRREVARLALLSLIQDGRIHPARIEELVEKAQKEVEETMRRAGEQAVLDAGVHGLHPDLIKLIGRLQFRYSYGENILQHSVEVSRLCGMLATEIGANVEVAKAGGLLHDVGKALDHEFEGSHIELGDEIADRYHLPAAVKAAIAEHHDDARGSVEAFLVAAADAMSAARPGSRRDTVELYLKRLEALEDVANSFPGVERSFAIQAGREVRILVQPDKIDDIGASNLARNVVKKIEENLVYPGQIKVTVVRETRATETAK
ncbi:MAG: ribonuclease Y [Chloroflexi bacterium]|nr:ribonuclease Y [Chloroflexota bacterium]